MTGGLHTTFVFDTPQAAKVAWERVAARCRNISANRWSVDRSLEGARAVTVLTEEEERPAFELARRLLARHGTEIATPAGVLSLLREKRQAVVGDGGGRRVIRTPQGTILLPGDVQVPFRRPQG